MYIMLSEVRTHIQCVVVMARPASTTFEFRHARSHTHRNKFRTHRTAKQQQKKSETHKKARVIITHAEES